MMKYRIMRRSALSYAIEFSSEVIRNSYPMEFSFSYEVLIRNDELSYPVEFTSEVRCYCI